MAITPEEMEKRLAALGLRESVLSNPNLSKQEASGLAFAARTGGSGQGFRNNVSVNNALVQRNLNRDLKRAKIDNTLAQAQQARGIGALNQARAGLEPEALGLKERKLNLDELFSQEELGLERERFGLEQRKFEEGGSQLTDLVTLQSTLAENLQDPESNPLFQKVSENIEALIGGRGSGSDIPENTIVNSNVFKQIQNALALNKDPRAISARLASLGLPPEEERAIRERIDLPSFAGPRRRSGRSLQDFEPTGESETAESTTGSGASPDRESNSTAYVYKDDKGRTVVASSLGDVPKKFRDKARKVSEGRLPEEFRGQVR